MTAGGRAPCPAAPHLAVALAQHLGVVAVRGQAAQAVRDHLQQGGG